MTNISWICTIVSIYLIIVRCNPPSFYFTSPEKVFLCDSLDCVLEITNAAECMDKLVIVWVSHDAENDAYLEIYIETILDMFKSIPSVHLVVEYRNVSLLTDSCPILPHKTIFVTHHDATRYDICVLPFLRKSFGYSSPVMLHLNHEFPWDADEVIGHTADGSLSCMTSSLPKVYEDYKYVFRNYYDHTLTNVSHYFPLGPLRPRRLQEHVAHAPLKLSSARKYWCLFTGRLEYRKESVYHNSRLDLLSLFKSTIRSSISDVERDILIDYDNQTNPSTNSAYSAGDYINMQKHMKNKTCWIIKDDLAISATTSRNSVSYNKYIDIMRETVNKYTVCMIVIYVYTYICHIILLQVFLPCPPGNNPETFRHYEVKLYST